MASSGDLVTRTYANFRGVDFGNDPGAVDLSRSPDALNVWKNYLNGAGDCIETRPGYKFLKKMQWRVNNIFFIDATTLLIHTGNYLYSCNDFPRMNNLVALALMNDTKSSMVLSGENVYIIDGLHYYKYSIKNNAVTNVKDEAYIPTTTISRSPTGGGKTKDDINCLTGKRINTFCSDGISTTYYLDSKYIDSVEKVYVNDILMTERTLTSLNDYYFNTEKGTIEFTIAPSRPAIIGNDNIRVEFTKVVEGYEERITKCTKMVMFDNRLFFSGNPEYPNAIFHSSVNNPAYVSDLDYYEDGTSALIKDLVVGNNVLYVLKESGQNKDTIFYHTPTTDSEYGRIYPRSQGNISTGCYSIGYNFKDFVVFLSREGLETIEGRIDSLQVLSHKSSNVDSKMIHASNYVNACMCEWNGYLVISTGKEIFLADSRKYCTINGKKEFEWFYWTISNNITSLANYKNNLYFGTDDGSIFVFEGTNDNGLSIKSYWTTPFDQMSYSQFRKTTNKRGNIAKVKNIQNGLTRIYVKTDKKDWKLLKEVYTSGFNYSDVDYNNFCYSSVDDFYITFRVKQKKIKHLSFKIECSELDKKFGIYQLNTSAYLGSFVK